MVKETLIEILKYSFASIGIYSCTKFLINMLKNYQQDNCDILLENFDKKEQKEEQKEECKEEMKKNEIKKKDDLSALSPSTIKEKLEFLEKKMEYVDVVNNRLTTLQMILGDLREKISSKN